MTGEAKDNGDQELQHPSQQEIDGRDTDSDGVETLDSDPEQLHLHHQIFGSDLVNQLEFLRRLQPEHITMIIENMKVAHASVAQDREQQRKYWLIAGIIVIIASIIYIVVFAILDLDHLIGPAAAAVSMGFGGFGISRGWRN